MRRIFLVLVTSTLIAACGEDVAVEPSVLPCSDGDGDGVCDVDDPCPDDDPDDSDGDGVCDADDACAGDDATGDSDGDGVCDDDDACVGNDGEGDPDGDGVCGDADVCEGNDATGDSDADGVCDDLDVCQGDDAAGDSDGDGVCDDVDVCQGNDAAGDSDGDGVCDDADACPLDAPDDDDDDDGVCDSDDICPLGDDNIDADSDGVPDACDACPLDAPDDDDDDDGVCDSDDICPQGDDNIDTDNDGIPDACEGCQGTVVVALPYGWGGSSSNSSLAWASLEADATPYGTCAIDVVDFGPGFTLQDFLNGGAELIWIGDPSGGTEIYSPTETQAIIDFAQQGHGGVVASYLLNHLNYDNSTLAMLFDVSPSALVNGGTTVATMVTVLDAGHPLFADLPSPFEAWSYPASQGVTSTWSAALGSNASIVAATASGDGVIIANETPNYRAVWFTGFVEYNAATDARQAVYNAILWTAERTP